MIGVFLDNVRIGTVCRFAGQPVPKRWVAWSVVHTASEENKACFRTKKEAIAWLTDQYPTDAGASA